MDVEDEVVSAAGPNQKAKRTVQELLGHSQVTLTMDTYSTVLPSVSREAAAQMDAVLRA
jgi:integrase